MMGIRLLLVALIVAGIVWTPAAALACSVAGPRPVDELLSDGELDDRPITGFYEQRQIAYFPSLFGIVGASSASVVTRYWGAEPNLSVADHGGSFWINGTCGEGPVDLGVTTVHVTIDRLADFERGSFSIVDLGEPGRLSPGAEARLAERFGQPVEVSMSVADYSVAWTYVLWRPLLLLSAVATLFAAVTGRIRRVRADAIDFNPLAFAAGLVGAMATSVAVEHYGASIGVKLAAVFAVAVAIAGLLRPIWAAGAGLLVAWLTINPGLFGGLGSEDSRTQAGLALLVIGGAGLVWSRDHWSRWVCSSVVVLGTIGLTLGALELRGFRNLAAGVAIAAVAALVAAATCWLLAFRADAAEPATALVTESG